LTKPDHAPGLDGEGARLWGGRWNSPGLPMVYCASSLALAALEALVHLPPAMRRKGGLPPMVAVALEVADAHTHDPTLPADMEEPQTRAIGDAWLREGLGLGLVVPSRVIRLERNVVLNPRHPDMSAVKVLLTEPFTFDDRLAY